MPWPPVDVHRLIASRLLADMRWGETRLPPAVSRNRLAGGRLIGKSAVRAVAGARPRPVGDAADRDGNDKVPHATSQGCKATSSLSGLTEWR